jgi:hypothetical protein
MKNEVVEYIAKCLECQKVKVEHRNPAGLVYPLLIPKFKWEVVTMDFITKLPRKRKQQDVIMVVVDKLTKAAHFILVKFTHKETNILYIYMREMLNCMVYPRQFFLTEIQNSHRIYGKDYLKDLEHI